MNLPVLTVTIKRSFLAMKIIKIKMMNGFLADSITIYVDGEIIQVLCYVEVFALRFGSVLR